MPQFSDFKMGWEARHFMEMLPNPILQAEELFGPKSLVGSGPAGYIESEKEEIAAQKEASPVVQRSFEGG